MGWKPDPLLLELFESAQKELAEALGILQRLHDDPAGAGQAQVTAQNCRIAKLRSAIEALEGALEQRSSRIVH